MHKYRRRIMVRRKEFGELGVDILIGDFFDDKFAAVAKPLEFEQIKNDEQNIIRLPTLSIDREQSQQLMDGLWESGIRPTAEITSIGERAAIKAHLADMRGLVDTLMREHFRNKSK